LLPESHAETQGASAAPWRARHRHREALWYAAPHEQRELLAQRRLIVRRGSGISRDLLGLRCARTVMTEDVRDPCDRAARRAQRLSGARDLQQAQLGVGHGEPQRAQRAWVSYGRAREERHPELGLALDEAAIERAQEPADLRSDERELRLAVVCWNRCHGG